MWKKEICLWYNIVAWSPSFKRDCSCCLMGLEYRFKGGKISGDVFHKYVQILTLMNYTLKDG